MSETPELHSAPSPPLAPSVAEENKSVPTTHHSPAPWTSHYNHGEPLGPELGELFSTTFPIGIISTDGDQRKMVALVFAQSPEETLANAHLILASPRLLTTLSDLFQGFLFLVGHTAFERGSSGAEEIRRLQLATGELLEEFRKAGVL